MLNYLKECPICRNKSFRKITTAKDNLITKESFDIVECDSCNFIFTNPRPLNSDLGKYYQSTEYDSHKTKSSTLKDILYNKVRDYSTRKKLKYINSISKGKKLLDIGCGAGYFINYCSKKKWKAEGMEPNLETIPLTDSGVKIHSTFSTIKENYFDVITLWHSLEHIPELDIVFYTMSNALKKNGKIIIAVPNIESYDSKKYQENWAALDVPRHLYHFTQQTMSKLVANYGLKITNIHPMVFDSFYVSLLSEKIISGKMNYFKALTTGLTSNSWAKKNNKNYSSLMYTLEKI